MVKLTDLIVIYNKLINVVIIKLFTNIGGNVKVSNKDYITHFGDYK